MATFPKVYVCNRYPGLGIGNLQFKNGMLAVTRMPDAIKIEKNEWYNVYIFPQDGVTLTAPKPAPTPVAAPEAPQAPVAVTPAPTIASAPTTPEAAPNPAPAAKEGVLEHIMEEIKEIL
jgi:hypothetical protein